MVAAAKALARRVLMLVAMSIVSLAARNAAANVILLVGPQFVGGPAFRVAANTEVEIKWQTDVAWLGFVEVFTVPDPDPGSICVTGSPCALVPTLVTFKNSEDALGNPIIATEHVVKIPVGPALQPDTTYYVFVDSYDPMNLNADVYNYPHLAPFYTGAQTLSNVQSNSITTTSATIAWQGNVIGFGKVVYGTTTLGSIVQDAFNMTDHAVVLSGLLPGTTYQFRASNVHAIDGDELASQTGQFTTASDELAFVMTAPSASPHVIDVGGTSVVSIRAKNGGTPVAGATIRFEIASTSAGSGTLAAAQAVTDTNGVASVAFTGSQPGLVRINASSSTAGVKTQTIAIVVH